jgi:outer membrane protein assembly factor BamB
VRPETGAYCVDLFTVVRFRAALSLTLTLLLSSAVAVHASTAPARHPAAAAAVSGSWTVYHHDNAHTGYDSTQPAATGATAGWTSPALNGQIYDEPLVYNGLVYVATLQNVVYALNQADGTVVWSKTLPAPQTSGWGCGNINPTGILGTGVIDATAGRVYYVPFLHQDLSYHLYGIDLATGAIVLNTQILPAGFDWKIQQERGALALSTDRTHVYVPFGGRDGDCGPYYGWVVGVPTNGAAPDEKFQTPGTGEGIWAAGGITVDDTTGNVFFATGNAIPCQGVLESDSVILTDKVLGSPHYFQPADWYAHWCVPDWDLGSVAPLLISPNLMFETGKYGQGFLIDPNNLGGTDGQLFPARNPYVGADVCAGTHGDASFGSEAYANGRLYLTCEGNGLVSLSVNTSTNTFSLCDSSCNAAGTWYAPVGTVGPPIVAGGIVWAVSIRGGGLYGFDANTGAQVYNSAGFSVNHFVTPSEAGGQIFVGAGNVVRSFNMTQGCSTVSLAPAPPSPQPAHTPVTFTATATGGNCTTPDYQFWLRAATSSAWTMVQDYGGGNAFNWTSTTQAGDYFVSVHARQNTSGVPFQSLATVTYRINATACASVSLSAAPPSPSLAGTPVTFTANAAACPNASYAFWRRSASSSMWTQVQAFSTTNTLAWTATLGNFFFSVWAKDASSTATFDANNTIPYSGTTPNCASVGLVAAPGSPQTAGTPLTFTANASGCTDANPLYEFWRRPVTSGTWTIVQPYSTTSTFNWDGSGASGGYFISVWAKDASSPTSTFDANRTTLFQINPAICGSVAMSAPSPASPQPAGTTVTFTANAPGCANPNPVFEFWVRPANSTTWTLAQQYGTSNQFVWNSPASAGDYYVSVWVKDASSATATFDANNTLLYTLN